MVCGRTKARVENSQMEKQQAQGSKSSLIPGCIQELISASLTSTDSQRSWRTGPYWVFLKQSIYFSCYITYNIG